MAGFRAFLTIVVLFFVLGCVSSSKYNARLADISALEQNAASLRSTIQQKEAELAQLNREQEDLKKQNAALSDDNKRLGDILNAKKDELNRTIAELRGKLANRDVEVSSLQNRVNELVKEKEQSEAEKEKSLEEMKKTYSNLMGEMQEEIKKGEVTITQLKNRLTLSMVEQVLFDSGSAAVKKDGKKVLHRVAGILKKAADRQVRVEGHTDNVPIGSALVAKFPTNWELSAARATNVVRYLQDDGIDPRLLSACGFSEYRPVAPNDTEEG